MHQDSESSVFHADDVGLHLSNARSRRGCLILLDYETIFRMLPGDEIDATSPYLEVATRRIHHKA